MPIAARTPVSDLNTSTIDSFVSSLQGSATGPRDARFDEVRRVWNAMVDRRPGLIVHAASADDVVKTIAFARDHRLLLSVRGGGHNAAGFGTCDAGIVLDLSPMNRVDVDPVARTASVQGGARWRDFDAAAQAHGLATTGGAISTTGVAGLTLGGGLGWLMRMYGMACDNLISVDLVTAAGERITASADQHADLFWALRGGGGNFGVATSLQFRLHPVGPIFGGLLVHPASRARDMLQAYRGFTQAAPDEQTTFAAMMTAPDGNRIAALVPVYVGDPAAGERALQPMRAFGPPVADMVGPMPYTALQQMMDNDFPAGMQVYWRSSFLKALDDAAIETLVAQFERITSPTSAILLEQFGGAVSRVARDATAFPHRDADYNLVVVARWTDPAEADRHIAWSRGVTTAMAPFTADAVYVNYLADEGDDRIRSAYGADIFDRLRRVKATYDPTNLFCVNQNITPQ